MFKNYYCMVKKGKCNDLVKKINLIINKLGLEGDVNELSVIYDCYVCICMKYNYELIKRISEISYCYGFVKCDNEFAYN